MHYGRASLTKLSRLPAFFVFPEQQLNVPAAAACLAASSLFEGGSGSTGGSKVLVFLDQPLLHQLQAFEGALRQAVEQRHGAAAAQRLVLPAVPRQHMEPEQPQQAQQQGQQAQQAGCCGGGGCDAAQPAEPPLAACCGGGGCRAATPRPPPQSAIGSGANGAAACLEVPSSSTAEDGSTLHSLAGYEWLLPAGVAVQDCGLAWVGAPDAPALLQLQLTYSACPWAVLDPALLPPAAGGSSGGGAEGSGAAAADDAAAAGCGALTEGLPLEISRALRRRYFLVEKARDANIVGILVSDECARLLRKAA